MPSTKPIPQKPRPKPVPVKPKPKTAAVRRFFKPKPPQKASTIVDDSTYQPAQTQKQDKTKAKSGDGGDDGYPKGDAAKGKPPYKDGAMPAHRDVAAYLQDQADKNAAANDELNAHQTEMLNKSAKAAEETANQQGAADPDKERADYVKQIEEGMDFEAYQHTQEYVDKARESREAIEKARAGT